MDSLLQAFAIPGKLAVRPFQTTDGHGYELARTNCIPDDVVAVVYDGADRGVDEANRYAHLLAASPVMLELLEEALGIWSERFDGPEDEDLSVPGADLVDWFAAWRLRVRAELQISSED